MRDALRQGSVDFGAAAIEAVPEEEARDWALAAKWELKVGERPPDSSFRVVAVVDGAVSQADGSCIMVESGSTDPQVLLELTGGQTVTVVLDGTGVRQTFMPAFDGSYSEDRSLSLEVPPGAVAHLRWVDSVSNPMRIDPPPGVSVRICGG